LYPVEKTKTAEKIGILLIFSAVFLNVVFGYLGIRGQNNILRQVSMSAIAVILTAYTTLTIWL
jgi:hypothetical protein